MWQVEFTSRFLVEIGFALQPGAHEINFVTFHLGRKQADGEAIAFVEIVAGMGAETLKKIL